MIRIFQKFGIKPLLLSLALITVLALAGISASALLIPSDDGRIHGCYLTHQNDLERQGNLRIVSDADQCKDVETSISWNETGLEGQPGPQGEQGEQGVPGPAGPLADNCDLERRINSVLIGFEISSECTLSRIAFLSNRGGDFDYYVMDSDGMNVDKLLDLDSWSEVDNAAKWAPDGSRFAFHANPLGNREIYVWNLLDGTLSNITNDSSNDLSPTWSPNGNRIAFHSQRGEGNDQIWIMDYPGGTPWQLMPNSADDSFPAWSPVDDRIAFVSSRDGDPEIWVIDLSTMEVNQLTHNNGVDPLKKPPADRRTGGFLRCFGTCS